MEIEQAKIILSVLADGVDPTTGEVLSEQDSCNQPSVIRALHLAVKIMEKEASKATRIQPENACKPWSPEEDELLATEYRSGISGAELAKSHKRSKGAISARLVHLGLISDRYMLK